ncbi:MAG: dihydrofolate reductase family protein, partial [Desulfobulbia bacterium]
MSLISSVYIATSLDGYIARENGDLDWLDAANAKVPEGEDCGFFDFMQTIDVLVMGRKSYEKVLSFGMWPYENTQVIVLSSNKIEIPNDLVENVSCSSESPKELYERLASEGAKRLY